MKLCGIWILYLLPMLGMSSACGCGEACLGYDSPSRCARCCTQLVKRSSPVSTNWIAEESKFAPPSEEDELLRLFGSSSSIQKRDGCGCNMGCFYSAPMECARCCSHGVRRSLGDVEGENEEFNLNDDATKETKESMSQLQQLINYLVILGEKKQQGRHLEKK